MPPEAASQWLLTVECIIWAAEEGLKVGVAKASAMGLVRMSVTVLFF